MIPHRQLTFGQKAKIALSLLFHKHTPLSAKAAIGAGVLYGLMPLDLIPDFLPLVGGIDDATVIITAILFFLNVTKSLRKQMEHDADIIDIKPF